MRYRLVSQDRVEDSKRCKKYAVDGEFRFLFWKFWGRKSAWCDRQDTAEKLMAFYKEKEKGHGEKVVVYVTGADTLTPEQEDTKQTIIERQKERDLRRKLLEG